MHVDRQTRTVEVTEYTLGGLSLKDVNSLLLAVEDWLGEHCAGDYRYQELAEMKDALKTIRDEPSDYWGR